MKRRVICVLLAVLMLVGLIPMMTTQVVAASTMSTSEKAISILKEFEGFSAKAYKDNGQYSIGYGSRCEANEYPNGITEEEADELMREYLAEMETSINKFADKYGLSFSQNEFDALMLFTYNLGTGWTSSDSDFRTAVIEGKTGNDFIYYMSRWCTDGTNVLPSLAARRLAEADMYLNGYYSTEAPDNFTYVLYNTNGGNSCDSKIQGYDATVPTEVRAIPVYTGYRFLGWYTAKEGGEWVTHLDASTKGITLYAHWQAEDGSVDEAGNILGDEVSYERTASAALTVYASPASGAEAVGTVAKGDKITVVADYIDGSSVKWGKLASGGWVMLTDTTTELTADAKPERSESDTLGTSVLVTVLGTDVNYRSGPGTNYSRLGSVVYGKQLVIFETADVNGTKWGRFSSGWICLLYTDYDAAIQQEESSDAPIATGIVKNCGSLRIRSGPGTSYSTLGTLLEGAAVQIYEQQVNGNMTWGRINANGWVSLSYVDVTPIVPDSNTQKDNVTDPTEPEATEPETTEPEETEPETTEPETTEPDTTEKDETTTVNALTGTVTASSLCVRKGAGTNNAVLKTLPKGTKVSITEQTVVSGRNWGKMADGWICMDYVKLDVTADTGSDTTGTGSTNTSETISGTVTAGSLCVRKGAGTTYAVLKTLSRGTAVSISEQKLVNGVVWGKIDAGWICLSYVNLTSTSASVSFSGTVTASNLCIRSAAGTSNAILGSYFRGTTVEILETATVNGTLWGRTVRGWICMDYVK